ncbi:MAG TPA: efflux RND transporter periplasmic adaptor subunit [Vicinamibacterales bacterium]|nr:efflux RND transporter periplasmic adaptor subunit [Vicinamibacterales bacterium]
MLNFLNTLVARRASGVAAGCAVAAALLLATACGSKPGPEAGAAAAGAGRGGAPQGVPVEILTLVEKPVEQSTELVGTVKSRLSVTVQPQVEGYLKKINVKSGDRVAAGKILFEIDDSSQLAVVAALESTRAAREADASYARQQAERLKKLLAAGAASQQELDQAEALQRSTQAQLKAVEEQIRQQKNEWQYSRVTAPAAGVIGDVPVREGDRVTRQTQLTTIEDNSQLELYLNVPVQEAPKVRPGQLVNILNDTGQVVGTEHVSFISPSADDQTQTVLVKTPISSRGGAVRSDQFVRARIIWSTAPTVTVPLVAVTRISGGYFVYVADPGPGGGLVAHQKPVVVGSLVGNDYVVISGLKAGDKVIVAGIQKIGEGAPVMALPPRGPAEPSKSGDAASPKSPQGTKAGDQK